MWIKENPINPRERVDCRSHTLSSNFNDKRTNKNWGQKFFFFFKDLHYINKGLLAPVMHKSWHEKNYGELIMEPHKWISVTKL